MGGGEGGRERKEERNQAATVNTQLLIITTNFSLASLELSLW